MEKDDETEKDMEALTEKVKELERANQGLKAETDKLAEENQRLKQALVGRNTDEDESELDKVRKVLKQATDTLEKFVAREKTSTIQKITEKTNLCTDELQEMGLEQLSLIKKTIDSLKGTEKGVKAAGSGQGRNDSELTVGDMYGTEQTGKPEVK